jgi:hypothetical protein
MELHKVAAVLRKFGGSDLTATLAGLEAAVKGLAADDLSHVLNSSGVDRELLTAAAALKQLARIIQPVDPFVAQTGVLA